VPTEQVRSTFEVMRAWLVAPRPATDPWSSAGAQAPSPVWSTGVSPARGVTGR